jgi:uncharacterized protein
MDKTLLEILVCPACRSKVVWEARAGGGTQEGEVLCSNSACGLRYPIREGIPVMLVEEAKKRKQEVGGRKPDL